MPIKHSNVDSNTGSNDFEPLENESRSRIPEDVPEWTEHNTHDPGQTLLSGMLGRTIRWFRNLFSGNELPSNLKLPPAKRTNKQKKGG
jgi:hypothetical protein